MPTLPPPPPGDAAVDWVAEHLGDLFGEPPRASSIPGGQPAADAALATRPHRLRQAPQSRAAGRPARSALAAHPDLPAVFVFDEPRLRLSGIRLVFLAQALAGRDIEVRRGEVATELAGRRLAVTHAPVPGFRTRAAALDVVALHPWPWLVQPGGGSLASYSAWRKSHGVGAAQRPRRNR